MRGKQALIATIAIVFVLVVVLGLSIIKPWSTPTFDMPKALAAIAAKEGAWDNPWTQNAAKVQDLRVRLAAEPNLRKRYQIRQEIGTRLLVGGQVEESIKELRQLLDDTVGSASPAQLDAWKADLALAYFRLGEVQNCLWGHNSASCILPIDPKAVHLHQTGAAEAIKIWTELLSASWADPENALADRWMLNIAYMVLGQYPDKVPKQWLIEPKAFESEYDIGRFEDIAPLRGVKKFGLSGGAIMDDFDNDGHFDLMVSSQGIQDQIEYFHNDGSGQFTNWTEKAGLTGITGGLYIVQADYDNDGYLDVFIPRGAWLHEHGKWPNSLLHNNGDGTFTDVTAKAGLLTYYPTQTAAWADFDGDGFLDLFVGNELMAPETTPYDPFLGRVHNPTWPADAKNFELYRNNGDGTFTEIGARSGIELHGMVKGATWCDVDNDGRPDLYASMRGPNRLFKNMGPGKDGITQFKDVTQQAGVAEPIMSFPTWCWDYNNDGWEDILVLPNGADLPNMVREYLGPRADAKGEHPRLYRNNGDGTFTNDTKETHLDRLLVAMGSNFGDLDNDGWLDFYVGTGSPALNMLVPNRMFRNADGKFFQDVTTSGGFGILQKGHAVAFGDVDHSGNQDVLANIGGAYESDKFWSVLFKNPGHPGNHWIKLKLAGVRANRGAVGARIKVSLTNRDGSLRDIHRTVTSGGSFGANPLQPHIGLGPAEKINQIEIRWPGSGLIQKFDGPIELDRLHSVKEGDPMLRR